MNNLNGKIVILTLTGIPNPQSSQDIMAEIKEIYDTKIGTMISLDKPFLLQNVNGQVKMIPVGKVNPLMRDTFEVMARNIVMLYEPKEMIINQYKSARSGIIMPSEGVTIGGRPQ